MSFDPANRLWGTFPVDDKPALAVAAPAAPRAFKPPPPPNFDVAVYASNAAQPTLPPYIIGSSAGANTGGFPADYQMDGADVALCLSQYGGFSGDMLVALVGIWWREAGWYPHQVVWRPATGDYSFGGGGFNMINKLGEQRRAAVGKALG